MRAGEREAGGAMIERRVAPTGGVVALCTCVREALLDVVRIGRIIIAGAVTGIAVRRRRCGVTVRVALGALKAGVRAGQRETGRAVVERSSAPAYS